MSRASIDAVRLRPPSVRQLSLVNTANGLQAANVIVTNTTMVRPSAHEMPLAEPRRRRASRRRQPRCPAESSRPRARAMVFSVTEGEERGLKYPGDVPVGRRRDRPNKIDLLPHLNFEPRAVPHENLPQRQSRCAHDRDVGQDRSECWEPARGSRRWPVTNDNTRAPASCRRATVDPEAIAGARLHDEGRTVGEDAYGNPGAQFEASGPRFHGGGAGESVTRRNPCRHRVPRAGWLKEMGVVRHIHLSHGPANVRTDCCSANVRGLVSLPRPRGRATASARCRPAALRLRD